MNEKKQLSTTEQFNLIIGIGSICIGAGFLIAFFIDCADDVWYHPFGQTMILSTIICIICGTIFIYEKKNDTPIFYTIMLTAYVISFIGVMAHFAEDLRIASDLACGLVDSLKWIADDEIWFGIIHAIIIGTLAARNVTASMQKEQSHTLTTIVAASACVVGIFCLVNMYTNYKAKETEDNFATYDEDTIVAIGMDGQKRK